MKIVIPLLTAFLAASPGFSLDRPALRVTVLVDDAAGRREARLQKAIADSIVRELRARGADSRILTGGIDEFEESVRRDDIYIAIGRARAVSDRLGALGGGGRVGSTHVGAEVGVVSSHAEAIVTIYDGDSLRTIDEIEVQGSSGGPALTGIGLGDRHGYGYISIPLFGRGHEHRAARNLAREAASRIAETLVEQDR